MTYGAFQMEGGTEGVAASNATTGGTGFVLNGGTALIRGAAKAHGNFGVRFSNVANAQCVGDWVFPTAANIQSISVVHRLPAAGFANQLTFGQIRHATGKIMDLIVGADGALLLVDASGGIFGNGTSPVLATAAQAAAYRGQQVRFTVRLNTTAGTVTVKAYDQATGSQIGATVTSSTANLTTNPVTRYRSGIISTNNSATSVDIDDLQYNDGSTAEITDLVETVPELTVSATVTPSSGPVPTTEVTATLSSTGGTANPKTYAVRVIFTAVKDGGGNWDYTNASTFLDSPYQTSPVFKFTPKDIGGYRVIPYVQQGV